MSDQMTIPHALDRAAAAHPQTEAVVDGPVRLTYPQLRDQVDAASRAFLARGVRRGDRIAVWAPNGVRWIVAALGAVSVGAVLVPVNTRFKGAEAHWQLARSGARMLLVENGFLDNDYVAMLAAQGTADGGAVLAARASAAGSPAAGPVRPDERHSADLPPIGSLPTLEAIVDLGGSGADPGDRGAELGSGGAGLTGWDEFIAGASQVGDDGLADRRAAITGDDVADILFTSGTTGKPKGAMCTHEQNVRTYLAWSGRTGVTHGDRYLIINPFFHSFGYKAGILACVLRGTTMVLQRVFEPAETMRLIEQERITVLPGPPTIYVSMLDEPRRAEFDLSSLRLAVTGAAVVPVPLVQRMRAELFSQVVTAYGLTESCGTVTCCTVDDDAETIATTSGRPIDGVRVRIADDKGAGLPPGQDGEILVRGYNVMLGYLDDDEATAAAIVDGWLITGDRGRLDGRGYLTISGRSKEMFVVGGFNVYPAEVEQVVAEHEAVAEAAVVGVPDERLGEVGRAYITVRPGTGVAADQLIAHCRERLANFKVPREVVILQDFPRNAAGKIQKTDLPQT